MEADKNILLEQYKLYVETAENVSKKRQTANTYFLSLNSFLLILSGYLTTIKTIRFQLLVFIIISAGIFICTFWISNLQSYRSLNSAKYKLIHEMEKQLPIKLFDEEWTLLGRGENKKTYLKLSVVEQRVPIIFIILYGLILNLSILSI
jgi:hypothetical protein